MMTRSTFCLQAARMIVLGLAAAPAGGKSTVARQLAELGATWINADRLAHDQLGQPETIDRLVAVFGPSILTADGTVDRRQIGGARVR